MENANNLGRLLTEHAENTTATGSTLLIGLVCLGLSVGMYFLFAGEKEMSFNKVLFGISGLLAITGGISCLWSAFKNRGLRVGLYENGLTVEKSGKRQTAFWNEIAVVKEKIEPMYLKGKYIYDRYNYAIEKTNGETFVLSNMISGIDEIGRVIKEKTAGRFETAAAEKTAN